MLIYKQDAVYLLNFQAFIYARYKSSKCDTR